jgi:hypothetical protein
MDEIEGIVLSGTKLNLDYYIEQTLDEDVVDEIYDTLWRKPSLIRWLMPWRTCRQTMTKWRSDL